MNKFAHHIPMTIYLICLFLIGRYIGGFIAKIDSHIVEYNDMRKRIELINLEGDKNNKRLDTILYKLKEYNKLNK